MYRDEILEEIKSLQPTYLAEWNPNNPKDVGWTVAELFATMLSELKEEMQHLPNKLFISYLDKLGFKQNPPLSARVPVTFTLTENFKGEALIPKGTVVGTKSKVNFETTEAFVASSSKLLSLFSIDSGKVVNYSEKLLSFEAMNIFESKEEYIYLGDENLFVGLKSSALHAQFEFFGKLINSENEGWYAFNENEAFNYIKKEINSIESYWIRSKETNAINVSDLTIEIPYAKLDAFFYNDVPIQFKSQRLQSAPLVTNIMAVKFSNNVVGSYSPPSLPSLELSYDMTTFLYPFGKKPQFNDSFYIASREAFSKKGLLIQVGFSNSDLYGDSFSWEYWNGKSWKVLSLGNRAFIVPLDMTLTAVNGEENYWIRIRLIDNSAYVKYACKGDNLTPNFTAPKLSSLRVTIAKQNINPQHQYIYRGNRYIDFNSFESTSIENNEKSLYLGFDKAFDTGLISFYFKIKRKEEDSKEHLTWYYFTEGVWKVLSVKDGTEAFSKSGFCQFLAPSYHEKKSLFGIKQFWIKAKLSKAEVFKIEAIYPNSIEVRQSKTIRDKLLGSSDGSGNQKFLLKEKNLFELKLWVLEASLPKDYNGYKDKFDEGYWVRWNAISDFNSTVSNERVYTFNASLSEIAFSDDRRGKIPPLGRENIRISYRTGGGEEGNVSKEEIDTLVDSLAYVDTVSNPIDASGGANLQSIENLKEMAPKQIKHRFRAVTEEDYVYLVRESSSAVAKVSVESHLKNAQKELLLYIVPFGEQNKIYPSIELLKRVENYITPLSSATVNVKVKGVEYVAVNLTLTIQLSDWSFASSMKSNINEQLQTFLHPLYGGTTGKGWDFGEAPSLADFYQLFSLIEGIKLIEEISFSPNEQSLLKKSNLICNGQHKIILKESEA